MLFGFGFNATNIQSCMKREYLTASFLILNNFLVMAKKLVYGLLFFLQAYPFRNN